MDDNYKYRIQGNYAYLVKHLKSNDIQDYLVQEFILTSEDNEHLSNIARNHSSNQATRKLLDLLTKSNDKRWYTVFCLALNEAGYDFIVDKLNSTNVAEVAQKALQQKKQQDERLEKLQSQVWAQCEMMVDLKKQVDCLQEKYKPYDELEGKLKDKGISSEDLVKTLIKYMESGGFSDKPVKSSGSCQPIEDVSDFMVTRKPNAAVPVNKKSDIKKIARELGIDTVFYMISKKLDMCGSIPLPNKYAETMRKMVDELNDQYDKQFEAIVDVVDLDESSGFQALVNIFNELFKEGANNWGRVCALYAYGGWMAMNSGVKLNDEKSLGRMHVLGDFIGFYVGEKLESWIESEGGWENFLSWFKRPREYKDQSYWGTIIGVLGIGVVLGATYLKS